jgi:hypothetical protein
MASPEWAVVLINKTTRNYPGTPYWPVAEVRRGQTPSTIGMKGKINSLKSGGETFPGAPIGLKVARLLRRIKTIEAFS